MPRNRWVQCRVIFVSRAAMAAALIAVPCAPARADAPGGDDPTIVVTGTRLHRPEGRDLDPLVTIDADYLRNRGLTNIADALNELPGIRGSVTPAGSQATFGQGVNFVNGLGLGSNRTLVLVDGRRVVPSNVPTAFTNAQPGTQVDLNVIPSILIERLDYVAIGGAPVYGTDAIAGTVNIILRRKLQGIDARATYGFTSEGDNPRWNLQFAGGSDFAGGRGHVTAAIGYERVTGVLANARKFYRDNVGFLPNPCTVLQAGLCNVFNLVSALGPVGRTAAGDGRVNPAIGFNNSATDGFPGMVLVRDVRIPSLTTGGLISSGAGAYAWQFAPDGSLVAFDKGIPFGAPIPGFLAAASTASGGQGLALNDYNQIASTTQRLNAALLLSYDIGDNASLFAEGLFYSGRSDELVQQPAYNATMQSGVSGALTFRTDNPFLPPQARQKLADLGYAGTFQLSRADVELADLTGYATNKLYRGVVGVNGGFHLGGRPFSYEASANYGRTDFTDYGQTIDQQRFINAINVASVNGKIVCSTTATVIGTTPVADPACVPLNLFGAGAPSPQAIAYVRQDTVSHSRLEQFVANVNVGGSPFDLFGNAVAFNAGFEHHEEKGRFGPDPFLVAGLGRTSAVLPMTGSYNLEELFGEVLIPLISPDNGLFVKRLDLFARARQVWGSTGHDFTAWSAGGAIAPVEGLRFRGNFTRSFRAPSILELYSPRTTIRVTVPDLCSAANMDAGPAPAVRRANCSAFLARYPNATPLAAATATVPAYSGGNPDLRYERADSYTYGIELQPAFLPRLVMTVDYVNVSISDPITTLTAAQINQGCFDNAQFDAADPAHGNPYCSLIARDASGQVVSDALSPGVTTGYVNGKAMKMSGVQATLAWAIPLDSVGIRGRLDLAANVFHLNYRLNDVTGVAPVRSDGILIDPKWQAQLRAHYSNRRWSAGVQVNYTGAQLLAVTNRGPSPNDTREFDHFKPFATVDCDFALEAAGGIRLAVSVTNLFNRQGQDYFGYLVPGSINDPLGRRFTFSLGKRW